MAKPASPWAVAGGRNVSRPTSGTTRGRARLPRSRASQAGFGEGQVMLGLPPCLEDAGRDFAPLELLAQLQPKEPAVGEAGDLQVVLLLDVPHPVHVGIHRLVVDREAFVVDDGIHACATRLRPPRAR